jgi:hypothetical protein
MPDEDSHLAVHARSQAHDPRFRGDDNARSLSPHNANLSRCQRRTNIIQEGNYAPAPTCICWY